MRDVMADELKALVVPQMLHVAHRAGDQVIDTDDLVAALEEAVAQVRADEPRPPRDRRPHGSLPGPGRRLFYPSAFAPPRSPQLPALRVSMLPPILPPGPESRHARPGDRLSAVAHHPAGS